ncbi:MAG: hypothetical protein ACYS26_01380 [Planctomycetota bacterium]|jgi:hypothetical protein
MFVPNHPTLRFARSLCAVVLATLAGLGETSAAQSGIPEVSGSRAIGEHFAVQLDWEAPELADQALEAVEALWPAANELYDLDDWERDAPLVVHLYGDDAGYARADAELTGGNFAQNGAFAHFATRSAHVLLAPAVDPAVLERFGLPNMTRRLLAHEAAHLVRYERYPNHAWHPEWFVHGTAGRLDQAALEALGRSDEQDPWEQQRWTRLEKLLESAKLPSLEDVLSGTGLGELGFYERYSVCEAAFAHVADHKRAPKLWAEMRRLGGGNEFQSKVLESVEGVLGKRYFKQADNAWRKELSKREPVWDEVLRHLSPLPADEFGEDAWLQLAFPRSNAIAFRNQRQEKLPWTLSGSLEVLPGAGQQANLILAEDATGFTSLAWNPGQGLTLFRYTRASNQWGRIEFVGARDLPTGRTVEFEVELNKTGVAVTWRTPRGAGDALSGEALFEFDKPEWRVGRWGLGAQAGSAVLWRGLEVRGR